MCTFCSIDVLGSHPDSTSVHSVYFVGHASILAASWQLPDSIVAAGSILVAYRQQLGSILAAAWQQIGKITVESWKHPRSVLAASWQHLANILAESW